MAIPTVFSGTSAGFLPHTACHGGPDCGSASDEVAGAVISRCTSYRTPRTITPRRSASSRSSVISALALNSSSDDTSCVHTWTHARIHTVDIVNDSCRVILSSARCARARERKRNAAADTTHCSSCIHISLSLSLSLSSCSSAASPTCTIHHKSHIKQKRNSQRVTYRLITHMRCEHIHARAISSIDAEAHSSATARCRQLVNGGLRCSTAEKHRRAGLEARNGFMYIF